MILRYKFAIFPILLISVGILIIAFTLISPLTKQADQQPSPSPSQFNNEVKGTSIQSQPSDEINGGVKVTKVIDGDTIEIEGGVRVRYIGIDTPETVHPSRPVQCFGREASNKNKELVEGKFVKLEKDVSETDKYARLLRYIYVGDVFINDFLVREGYAYSSSYPPDIKHQDQFLAAQIEARENNRGLWGSCSGQTSVIDGDCNIKAIFPLVVIKFIIL